MALIISRISQYLHHVISDECFSAVWITSYPREDDGGVSSVCFILESNARECTFHINSDNSKASHNSRQANSFWGERRVTLHKANEPRLPKCRQLVAIRYCPTRTEEYISGIWDRLDNPWIQCKYFGALIRPTLSCQSAGIVSRGELWDPPTQKDRIFSQFLKGWFMVNGSFNSIIRWPDVDSQHRSSVRGSFSGWGLTTMNSPLDNWGFVGEAHFRKFKPNDCRSVSISLLIIIVSFTVFAPVKRSST